MDLTTRLFHTQLNPFASRRSPLSACRPFWNTKKMIGHIAFTNYTKMHKKVWFIKVRRTKDMNKGNIKVEAAFVGNSLFSIYSHCSLWCSMMLGQIVSSNVPSVVKALLLLLYVRRYFYYVKQTIALSFVDHSGQSQLGGSTLGCRLTGCTIYYARFIPRFFSLAQATSSSI